MICIFFFNRRERPRLASAKYQCGRGWCAQCCAITCCTERKGTSAPVLLTRSSGKPPRADVRFITPGVRRGCFHLFLRLSRTQPQWRNSRFLNSKRCWIRNSSSSVARQLQRQRGRVRAGRWLGEERRWVDGFLPRAQRQRAEPRYQVLILFFREPGNGGRPSAECAEPGRRAAEPGCVQRSRLCGQPHEHLEHKPRSPLEHSLADRCSCLHVFSAGATTFLVAQQS